MHHCGINVALSESKELASCIEVEPFFLQLNSLSHTQTHTRIGILTLRYEMWYSSKTWTLPMLSLVPTKVNGTIPCVNKTNEHNTHVSMGLKWKEDVNIIFIEQTTFMGHLSVLYSSIISSITGVAVAGLLPVGVACCHCLLLSWPSLHPTCPQSPGWPYRSYQSLCLRSERSDKDDKAGSKNETQL